MGKEKIHPEELRDKQRRGKDVSFITLYQNNDQK